MATVFDDLVGQEDAVTILQGATEAARNGDETQEMTHAWIFTGPPGSGRSSAHKVAAEHATNVAAPNHTPTPMLRS